MRVLPLFAALFWCVSAVTAAAIDVKAAVLRIDYPSLLPISRYDLKPDDLGFADHRLADQLSEQFEESLQGR